VDKITGKKKNVKKDEDEDKNFTETELKQIFKIKMLLNITDIKFRQNEPLGYCFVLNEEKSLIDEKKNDEKINMINHNQLIHFDRNILLYDVTKFNYVRTNVKEIEEEADDDISGSIEPNQLNADLNNSLASLRSKKRNDSLNSFRSNANNNSKTNKKKSDESSSSSSSSSYDENEEKKKKNPLTKEAIMALKFKDSETVRAFILNLPFYGSDINLTRKSPNGSDFRVGFGFEPNIKISVASHIHKIDKIYAVDKKNLNKIKKEMFAKRHTLESNLFNDNKLDENLEDNKEGDNNKEGDEKKENENDKDNNILDSNLGFNSNAHLKSIFSKKSFYFLQICSIIYFIILICLYISEFILTYNKFNQLKDNVNYSEVQFEILSSLMYCKFFLTEAVLAQNHEYKIYDTHYVNHEQYIEAMMEQLRKYRENIYTCLNEFSEPEKIGKDFAEYTANKFLLVRMLVASQNDSKLVPFWSGINQIPTSIFSIAKIENNITDINLSNRNVYDLMMNLVNSYFVGWRDTTSLVINFIKGSSKMNIALIFIFIISFVFCFLYIIIFYRVLSKFISDGTRPVDLILTIKKSKFEELKIICENYMNTLMNKFLGEEVDKVEEDPAKAKITTSIGVSDNDIVISKFKKRNIYNHSVFSNQKFSKIYIGCALSMIIFQIYFIVKFTYSKETFKDISLCEDVNNVTRNAEVDVVMSYNVIKAFFLDPTVPLLNETNSTFILQERVKNITDAVEDWTKFTFLYMKNTGKNYMNKFIDLFFKNITGINIGGFKDEDFLGSMKYGFRSFISRYLSLMKTGALMDLDHVNKTDIMNDEELGENGLKIVYVIKPWFEVINQELKDTLENIFDRMILLCLCMFIGFLVGSIVIYALIWKNIEFQLEKYLINSIELINLIPENIKEDLVNKINEDKEFKESHE
jgi:hypothetical protein